MRKIVLTGGGTAGHCYPALSLLPILRERFEEIYYIGSKNNIEKDIVPKYGIPYYSVSCIKLERKITLRNFKIPFILLKGIKEAKSHLKRLKPDVVFSKGGFVSLPVVIAASKLKIPVVIHESDMSMGLTNKICSKYAKVICTSFLSTAMRTDKAVFTGSPIRQELYGGNAEKIKGQFKDYSRPVLTIIGGSSGSKKLNSLVASAISTLVEHFNIYHIFGKNNSLPNFSHPNYIVTPYEDSMKDVYKASDIVLSRGGSNVLFELLALKKPALIIPLPKEASRGDQIENAEYFMKKGCFLKANQDELNKDKLIEHILTLYSNRHLYKEKISEYQNVDGTIKICNIITDTIKN